MILDSLTLTNIRSHRDTTVTFSEGITLFRGDIGSGKSTILMGIEFALFGPGSFKSEGLLARGADSGEVMLSFHIGEDSYEVGRSLKSSHKGVTQDTKGAYLRVNGVQEPLSVRQMRSRMLEILGLNEPSGTNTKSRIYRYAVFTPQDEMKSILYDPKQRLETIRKIFRTEDYQRAISNSEGLKSEIRESMGRLRGRCENIDARRDELAESQKRLKDTERVIHEQEAQEQKLEGEESSAGDKLRAYDERLGKKHELEVRAAGIRSKIGGEQHIRDASMAKIDSNTKRINAIRNSSEARLEDLRKPTERSTGQLSAEIQGLARLHEDITRVRSAIESAQSQISSVRERIKKCLDATSWDDDYDYDEGSSSSSSDDGDGDGDNIIDTMDAAVLQDRADSLESRLGASQEELDGLRRQHDATNTDKIKTEHEIATLQRSVSDLATLGAKCTLCGSILTEDHMKQQESERRGLLQDATSRLADLQGVHDKQSGQIQDVDSEVGSMRVRLEELRSAAAHAKEHGRLSEQLAKQQSELRKLDSQNDTQDEPAYQKRKTDQTPLEYLTGLKDALARYEAAAERARGAEREAASLESSNKTEDRLIAESDSRAARYRSELESIHEELGQYADDERARSEAGDRFESIRASLQDAREKLATARANRASESERIQGLKSEIQEQERFVTLYKKNAAYADWLADFFVPTVGRIEKDVLLSLQRSFDESYTAWYDQLMIDDPTKESHINEEFAPVVTQDGYDQNVEYLSGGERTSVALSYRLALNHEARKQTRGLESNLLILDEPTDGLSRSQLAHVREILQGLDSRQIILVSHDPELDSHADQVFLVEKSSGVSSVNLVQQS